MREQHTQTGLHFPSESLRRGTSEVELRKLSSVTGTAQQTQGLDHVGVQCPQYSQSQSSQTRNCEAGKVFIFEIFMFTNAQIRNSLGSPSSTCVSQPCIWDCRQSSRVHGEMLPCGEVQVSLLLVGEGFDPT
jgi:hypothetical protein